MEVVRISAMIDEQNVQRGPAVSEEEFAA